MIILVSLSIPAPLNAHQKAESNKNTDITRVVIKHLLKNDKYQPLLEGSKESVGLESGRVVKLRGQRGSIHSTKNYEELLIILRGKATAIIEGKDYSVRKGDIVYIPPHHIHHLVNDRSRRLEYIYVAAPAL